MGSVLPELIHIYRLQGLIHPLADLFRGDAQIFRCKGHILLHHIGDDLVVRVLKHHTHRAADVQQPVLIRSVNAVHVHLASAGQQDSVHMLGQGGFSAPVVPQDGYKGAFLDGQIYAVQHHWGHPLGRRVGETEVFSFDDGVAHMIALSG